MGAAGACYIAQLSPHYFQDPKNLPNPKPKRLRLWEAGLGAREAGARVLEFKVA